MTEHDAVTASSLPLTVDLLVEQFAACGLQAGQTVLVHSSMSRLGWVAGDGQAVIMALLRVLGDSGTLVMPTHTATNTDPANWRSRAVPEAWWPHIRAYMPAFDPARTPSSMMGKLPELFRTWPHVLRSNHPIGSFAAHGPQAAALTAPQPLEPMFGDDSPIGRLYKLDGYVLLLGVNHENNTSLHLAEYRADFPKRWRRDGSAALVDGVRQWVPFEMMRLTNNDFNLLGAAYEAQIGYTPGKVGSADARFLRQRPLVDFAVGWMGANRRDMVYS